MHFHSGNANLSCKLSSCSATSACNMTASIRAAHGELDQSHAPTKEKKTEQLPDPAYHTAGTEHEARESQRQ